MFYIYICVCEFLLCIHSVKNREKVNLLKSYYKLKISNYNKGMYEIQIFF